MNISKPSNAELHTRRGFTLVEMLVGMAITLVMMAAVVNLFANISTGVRNRRAAMEISAELRVARSRLYKDLAGATALKYPKDAFSAMLKPDVNNPPDGYFEIVEGNWSDENPSPLLDGNPANGEIDRGTSLLPSSNAFLDQDGIPQIDSEGKPNNPLVVTDGRSAVTTVTVWGGASRSTSCTIQSSAEGAYAMRRRGSLLVTSSGMPSRGTSLVDGRRSKTIQIVG